MGFICGLIKRLLKSALYFAIFCALVVLIPNLPPYADFPVIKLEPLQPRVGPLAPNEILNNAQKLYLNKLLGPEAFEVIGDDVYTSLVTGEVVKVSPGGHVTFVTKVGQPCTGRAQEHICGRPLGLKIDTKTNTLYLADAFHGIWKVDLKTDKKQLLVSPRVEIEGRTPKVFNALSLTKDGFYWTDSSTNFYLDNGVIDVLTGPSGRLLRYNTARNESKVLIDKLYFANGVAVSPDGGSVVVSETMAFRLVKYHVDGPKRGQHEPFVTGLPGIPDNIQVLPDGSGILVALYAVHEDEDPIVIRSLAEVPVVRKFLARLFKLIQIPFEFLHSVYPHFIFEEAIHFIGHFKTMTYSKSGLMVVDWNGNIIETYYNTDKTMGPISDAIVYKGNLYAGSTNAQNYIASIPAPPLLKKAFSVTSKPEVKVEEPKVEKTTPKPTTTTPKPTTTTPKPTTTTPKPTTTTPKPTTTTPKPTTTTTPKPSTTTTPKPTTTTPKPTTTTPKPTRTTSKPTTPTPKPTTTTPKPTTTPQPTTTTSKPTTESVKEPNQIPIKEDITSDTTKPNKETLKVIKKGGPTEIPNPTP